MSREEITLKSVNKRKLRFYIKAVIPSLATKANKHDFHSRDFAIAISDSPTAIGIIDLAARPRRWVSI